MVFNLGAGALGSGGSDDRRKQMNLSVFRKDKKNVGDWWSVPMRHFSFTTTDNRDLILPDEIPNEDGVVILGGGGLGRVDFEAYPVTSRLIRPLPPSL